MKLLSLSCVLPCTPNALITPLHAPMFLKMFVFMCVFSSQFTFLKINFRSTIRLSNSLDPDQARRVVGPDLAPNCLQRLSVESEETSRQRAKQPQHEKRVYERQNAYG